MATATGWIWRENLKALLDEIARRCGEELDEGVEKVLLDDIELSDPDATPPRWATNSFYGSHSIIGRFGVEAGTHVIWVQLEGDELAIAELKVLLGVMSHYRLVGPKPH